MLSEIETINGENTVFTIKISDSKNGYLWILAAKKKKRSGAASKKILVQKIYWKTFTDIIRNNLFYNKKILEADLKLLGEKLDRVVSDLQDSLKNDNSQKQSKLASDEIAKKELKQQLIEMSERIAKKQEILGNYILN